MVEDSARAGVPATCDTPPRVPLLDFPGDRRRRGRGAPMPALAPRAAWWHAVRRAADRRPGPAEHQREHARRSPSRRPGRRRRRRPRGRRPEPLPGPGVHRAARGPRRPTWVTVLDAGSGLGGQREQRGAPAGAAGVRRPGPDGARLHPDVRDVPAVLPWHRHRLDRRPARRDGGDFALDAETRGSRRCGEPRPDVVFLCTARTTRPAPRSRSRSSRPCTTPPTDRRRRRGVRRVRPRGHSQRSRPCCQAASGSRSAAR